MANFPEQVEQQASPGRGGVDRLRDGAEPHPALFQRRHGLDQVRQGTAEAVQLSGGQHTAITHVVKRRLQPGMVGAHAEGAVLSTLAQPAVASVSSWQRRILVRPAC